MKKLIAIIVVVVVELFMLFLTLSVFNTDENNLLFSGGSVGSTMEMFSPNAFITLILFILTILCSIFYRKKLKPFLISFLIFFSLWFLSGRTIGVHWTGEVTTGWFNISAEKLILYDEQSKDSNIIEETSLESTFLFKVKFVNNYKEENIFVGPIIRKDLMDYFNKSN